MCLLSLSLLSFKSDSDHSNFSDNSINDYNEVSFIIRGDDRSLVRIGVGPSVGKGACCTGVAKSSFVRFKDKVGDVVWDGDTRKVIFTLSSESNNKTYKLQ